MTPGLKTIIAGSRCITDFKVIKDAIAKSGLQISEVVSGGATGVDKLGERWANEQTTPIPIKSFKPAYNPGVTYDTSAPLRRNVEMAAYGDALIAIWDGVSTGTKHMIGCAEKRHLKIHIFLCGNKQTTLPFLVAPRLAIRFVCQDCSTRFDTEEKLDQHCCCGGIYQSPHTPKPSDVQCHNQHKQKPVL